MIKDYMDSFFKAEINLIIFIQNKFFNHEDFIGYFSTFFGSTFLFLYIVPILALYSTKLYHRMMISCVASEFLNISLKWIIDEDRPYWWIFETNAYTSLTRPTLYQTERTCETSAGSPSGHLMLAGCFMHVIYDEINSQIDKKNSKHKFMFKNFNRLSLIVILTLTAVSRQYYAAHFLHQCIFGCVIGKLVSILMTRGKLFEKIARFGKKSWILVVITMILIVLSIYWAHKLISGNPMKSVQLAFKYCNDPLHPKPETTVLFLAIRCISMACGVLFTAPIIKKEPKIDVKKATIVIGILMLLQIMAISYTPRTYKIFVFYSYSFMAYGLFQFLLFYITPKYCTLKDADVKIKIN